MARPQKRGFDYFPLDVNFFNDVKVKVLRSRFGSKGICVYLYLLCQIYSENGYYLFLNDDLEYIISDDLNIDVNLVKQVIVFLCDRAMFDNNLVTSDNVLTSVGIQRRFQEMIRSRAEKRSAEVNLKYWLLDDRQTAGYIAPKNSFSENNWSYSEKNPGYSENNDTKESKVNKSKINTLSNARAREEETGEVIKAQERYTGKNGNLTLSTDQYEELLRKGIPQEYIDHFSDKLKKCGYQYADHFATIMDWWQRDKAVPPWNHSGKGKEKKPFVPTLGNSYDTDDFFQAAVSKSLGEAKKLLEGESITNENEDQDHK